MALEENDMKTVLRPHEHGHYVHYLPIVVGLTAAFGLLLLYFWVAFILSLEPRYFPYISDLGSHTTDESSCVFLLILTIAAVGYALIGLAVHDIFSSILDRQYVSASTYLKLKNAMLTSSISDMRNAAQFSPQDCKDMSRIMSSYDARCKLNDASLKIGAAGLVGVFMVGVWPDSLNQPLHNTGAALVFFCVPTYVIIMNTLINRIEKDSAVMNDILEENELFMRQQESRRRAQVLHIHHPYGKTMGERLFACCEDKSRMMQEHQFIRWRNFLFMLMILLGAVYLILHSADIVFGAIVQWAFIFSFLVYFSLFTKLLRNTRIRYHADNYNL